MQQAVENVPPERARIPVKPQPEQRAEDAGSGDIGDHGVQPPGQENFQGEQEQREAAEHQLGHDRAPEVVRSGKFDGFESHA